MPTKHHPTTAAPLRTWDCYSLGCICSSSRWWNANCTVGCTISNPLWAATQIFLYSDLKPQEKCVHAFIEIGIPRNFFPNSYSPFQCTNICIVPHTHTHIYVFVLSTASSNLCYRSPSLLPPPSPAHPQPQQGSKAEVLIYIQKQVLAQRQNEGRVQETTHLCSSQCSFPHLVVIRAG